MPIMKGTYIFGQGRNGWSETYYIEATDYDAAKTRFADLATARAKLLGKGSYIDGARVSDEAILNDGFPLDLGTTTATQEAVTDTPWNSIYVRAQAGALYRRQFHLRGVPDSWISIDPATGRGIIPATAREAFDTWALWCTKRAPIIKMKVMTKTTAAVKIAGAPEQDGLFTKFNVGAVVGLADTPYVLMRKWKGKDKRLLNRRWDVISYAAPWVKLSVPWAWLVEPTLDYNGQLMQRIPGYADMTDLYLTRFASKKTGRAFFVSAGKSAPKKDPITGGIMLGITGGGF